MKIIIEYIKIRIIVLANLISKVRRANILHIDLFN